MSLRTNGLLRMVSQPGLTIVLVSALLIASSAGILWWQGQQILDNYTRILEQKDALEKLNARTWGVRYQEDNQGRFLVLPEGVKADTNWTFDNGTKIGIRMVRE
jgi:hypothetical protein